jgi:hypothetical protein
MKSPKSETVDVKTDPIIARFRREIRHLKVLMAAWGVTITIAWHVFDPPPCPNSSAATPHGCQQPHVATNCGEAVPGPAP